MDLTRAQLQILHDAMHRELNAARTAAKQEVHNIVRVALDAAQN